MKDVNELFSKIPVDDIASRLKVSSTDAQNAVAVALPSLLGGLHANAKNPAGEASLLEALLGKDTSLVTGGIDLDSIDVKDGRKIVKNVFGKKTNAVTARLGATSGTGSSLMKKLLPILAPIVLAFVAQKALGSKKTTSTSGGLGDVLGTILGGGLGGSSGGGLGDVLGSVLGGGASSSGGGLGGLEDILGGLLGGGKTK